MGWKGRSPAERGDAHAPAGGGGGESLVDGECEVVRRHFHQRDLVGGLTGHQAERPTGPGARKLRRSAKGPLVWSWVSVGERSSCLSSRGSLTPRTKKGNPPASLERAIGLSGIAGRALPVWRRRDQTESLLGSATVCEVKIVRESDRTREIVLEGDSGVVRDRVFSFSLFVT